jgi:hypothetical protein
MASTLSSPSTFPTATSGASISGRHGVRVEAVYIPRLMLETHGTIEFAAADLPTASIALLDFRFPRNWVDRTGHLTVFATVGHIGSGTVDSVAVMELFNIGGVIMLAAPDPTSLRPLTSRPRPPADRIPASDDGEDDTPRGWTIEEVCFQQSQPVGVSGSIITNEVVSAECQSGWEWLPSGDLCELGGFYLYEHRSGGLIGG